MQGHIKIECMEEFDIPEILEIENQSFDNPWKEKFFLDEISNPDSNNYIAKIRLNPISKTIAFISFRVVLCEMELLKIAVAPEYRNTGVATELLRTGLRYSRKKGVEHSFLEVNEKNKGAINFYRKNGYKCCGIRAGYYNGENALIMKREV